MIDKIKEIVEKTKTKDSVKKKFTELLGNVSRYVDCGPGIVSPVTVKNSLDGMYSLARVWFGKETSDLIEELEKEVLTIPEPEEKTKDDENICKARTSKATSEIPNYVKKILVPTELRKLDVCYLPIGPKWHYCLVYKVDKDICYIIPITSNKDGKFLGHEIKKSRFLKGTAVYTITQIPTDLALEKFVMVYDSTTEGNQIIRETREHLKTILKL